MRVISFAAATCVLLVASACSSHASSSNESTPSTLRVDTSAGALAAVDVTQCKENGPESVLVSGTVRNTATTPASYVIQLSIRGRDGRALYASSAEARDVGPNQAGRWTASVQGRYQAGMTCRATGVSRV